jgi:uncharacterized protein (TIGR00255 family)
LPANIRPVGIEMLTETDQKTNSGTISQESPKSARAPDTQLRSMTGFAQAAVQEEGFSVSLSLRSVNHRTLDLHLNLPEQLSHMEPALRREVAAFRPRGHLQLRVSLEGAAASSPAVDETLAGKYIDLFRRLAERYDLSLETAMQSLPQLPGVVSFNNSNSSQPVSPIVESAVLRAVREALREWDAMRAREGSIIEDELRSRTGTISGSVERLQKLREQMLPVAQTKLRERLQEWLGQDAIDATRLAQEAALLAERTDVSEEILRLKAHLTQFPEMLGSDAEVGKKLDFLLQEIQREVNTLLAKTTGLGESGLQMTQTALEIKGEVEKLREQVQNVQ